MTIVDAITRRNRPQPRNGELVDALRRVDAELTGVPQDYVPQRPMETVAPRPETVEEMMERRTWLKDELAQHQKHVNALVGDIDKLTAAIKAELERLNGLLNNEQEQAKTDTTEEPQQ